jgi:hypothetical protein
MADAPCIVGVLAVVAGPLWPGYFGALLAVVGFGIIVLGRALLAVVLS